MKANLKKVVSSMLAVTAIASSGFEAFAIQYPNSFWALESNYQTAVESQNYYDIINYGNQEIDLMEKLPIERDLYGAIGTRAYMIAGAYEALNEYEKSVPYHKKYAECAAVMDWTDGERVSNAKVSAFTPDLELYTLTKEPVKYFGAKFEPVAGTYFGQVAEVSEARDSMVIIYQEYGDYNTLDWLNKALSDAERENKCVELALNFPREGYQIKDILNDGDFISRFVNVLMNNPNLKIFLRIGAEMNVWTASPDPWQYKQAFIKIATAVRNYCNNVATVWSVSHTSTNGIEMNDFYPGDEYVDWVGVSAYGVRHFLAQYWSDNINEIYFKSGDGAYPIKLLEEVISKYGDRKPIMISEGGSARYTRGLVNQAHEEWAKLNLLQFYSAVCMKFPQIKLMGYFNKIQQGEDHYFEMNSVPEIKNAYLSVTSSPWFIQNGEDSAMSFKAVQGTVEAGNTLEIYARPYVFKDQQPRVDYRIDGTWVGAAVYMPYKNTLDLSGLSYGNHTLEAVVTTNGVEKMRKTYTINKTEEASSPSGFSDTGSLTAEEQKALEYAVNRGIIDGYDNNTFRPDNKITRAEFAAIVSRAFNYSPIAPCSFADASDHWASNYIRACVDVGAIDGTDDNNFSPDTNVLLAHASKILDVCSGFTTGEGLEYPYGFIYTAYARNMYKNMSRYMRNTTSSGNSLLSAEELALFHGDELTRIEVAMMIYNIFNPY